MEFRRGSHMLNTWNLHIHASATPWRSIEISHRGDRCKLPSWEAHALAMCRRSWQTMSNSSGCVCLNVKKHKTSNKTGSGLGLELGLWRQQWLSQANQEYARLCTRADRFRIEIFLTVATDRKKRNQRARERALRDGSSTGGYSSAPPPPKKEREKVQMEYLGQVTFDLVYRSPERNQKFCFLC